MTEVAVVLVDGTEQIEVEYDTPLWHETLAWARFHGLDPNIIPSGSVVRRDAARRRIEYQEFVRGEHGIIVVEDNEPVIVDRVEQGEAAPLPFPRRR